MMTFQEIFNASIAHLRKQGKQSQGSGGCAYRDEEGNSCAVGCFISDNDYLESFDRIDNDYGTVVDSKILNPAFKQALKNSGISFDDPKMLPFLKELQGAHDSASNDFLRDLELNMRLLASKHGLIYNPPLERSYNNA